VTVAVRHHGVDGLAGADLAAADDDRDLEDPRRQVLQGPLQLDALGSTGSVRKDGLILGGGDLGHDRNLHSARRGQAKARCTDEQRGTVWSKEGLRTNPCVPLFVCTSSFCLSCILGTPNCSL